MAVPTSNNAPESRLIERVLNGETQVFYDLVQPHERTIFLMALSILRNEADASDVAQEAVLKAFANLRSFRGNAKFSTWLVQIALNEARMRVRKDYRHPHESLSEPDDSDASDYLPINLTDWREIPSESLERQELRRLLTEALASLPQLYREVFVLRDVQQLPIEETAQVLGISAANVKTRLRRARLQMRDAVSIGWGASADEAFKDERTLPIPCAEVAREISNYMEGDVSVELRARIEAHVRACRRCAALVSSTRNLLRLVCDRRAFSLPAGLARHLHRRFSAQTGVPERDTGEVC